MKLWYINTKKDNLKWREMTDREKGIQCTGSPYCDEEVCRCGKYNCEDDQ